MYFKAITFLVVMILAGQLQAGKIDTLGTPIINEFSQMICPGSDYEGYTFAGTFRDTFELASCDSIRIVHLDFFSTPETNEILCLQEILTPIPGFPNQPGVYVDIRIDSNGCQYDHIITAILPQENGYFEVSLCEDEIYITQDKMIIDTAGVFVFELQDNNGCSYTNTYDVTILEKKEDIYVTICAADAGEDAGIYSTLIIDGIHCPHSLFTEVLPATEDIITDAFICPGDTIIWNNQSYTQTGSFYFDLVDANGCDYQDILRVFDAPSADCMTATQDIRALPQIELYPNPVASILTISNLNSNQAQVVEIYNSTGQLMTKDQIIAQQLDVNVSNWNSGSYYVKLSMDNQTSVTKAFFKN